jgi:hypothetical protein
MAEHAYLVAFKAESMETRQEVIGWLRDHDAVHILADVWVLKSQFPHAGDITHELKRFQNLRGPMIVLKLNQATGWSHEALSEQADGWIRANLGP